MAIFTKTFVRCDACDHEAELPSSNGSGSWYKVETQIHRLDQQAEKSETITSRSMELCPSCYSALQDSEFSTLFETGKEGAPSPVVSITPDTD